jgi:MFS family permease
MSQQHATLAAPGGRVLTGAAAPWTVAAVLGLMFMGGALPTPLYEIYRQQFHFSEIVLTLLFAVYVVGALAALFVLGRASDQIGRRRMMLPVIVIAAISTLAFLLPASLPVLFVGRALSGFAIGLASGTATAWIAELEPAGHRGRATLIAVGANQVGLAIGPLLAGCLAQFAPDPLRLVYVVYLAMLLPAGFAVAKVQETLADPVRRLRQVELRPRLGVPAELWPQFVAPALTAFAIFSLLGFSTGLTSTLLTQSLHETSRAVGGAVVFELFLVGAVTVYVSGALPSRTAMFVGLALLLPTMVLLVLAQAKASMPLLVADMALAGVAAALGYRGSLQVVNEIAPTGRHAELVSTYLLACYAGVSLPVIGIGVMSQWAGPLIADLVFAVVIAAAAILALIVAARYTPPHGRGSFAQNA